MDEERLRELMHSLGPAEQPPSKVSVEMARARGRRQLRWRRAGMVGTPVLAVGLIAGLVAGVTGQPGGTGHRGVLTLPPALPRGCFIGAPHLILSPAVARPDQLVGVSVRGAWPSGTPRDLVSRFSYAGQLGIVSGSRFIPRYFLLPGIPGALPHARSTPVTGGVQEIGPVPVWAIPGLAANRPFEIKVPRVSPGYYVMEFDSQPAYGQTKTYTLCATLRVTDGPVRPAPRASSAGATPGTVTGIFLMVGGPATPAHPNGVRIPLPGRVIATSSTGKRYLVKVGTSGRFTMSLPAGTYQLTGYSPKVHSGNTEMRCVAAHRVHVQGGKPPMRGDVYCSVP